VNRFGLGVRHTGQAGRPEASASLSGAMAKSFRQKIWKGELNSDNFDVKTRDTTYTPDRIRGRSTT
jgi:hypothetical protein